MIYKVLAHVGELHETEEEALWHYFTGDIYIAIAFFLVLMAEVLALHWLRFRIQTIMNVVLVILFATAVIGWQFVPMLSALSIALGFLIALSPLLARFFIKK